MTVGTDPFKDLVQNQPPIGSRQPAQKATSSRSELLN